MRILFITSYNLTTNPRLAKEIKLATGLGHQVHFVGFELGGWSARVENEIKNDYAGEKTYLPARRKPLWKWLVNTAITRIARLLYPLFPRNIKLASYAHDRRSRQLWQFIKKLPADYDLIIAHNLAALYPAWRLWKKTGIAFAFDVEDYHPGEAISSGATQERKRRVLLMEKLLPKATYITFASPMIGQLTRRLIPDYPASRYQLINNVFEQAEFVYIPPDKGKVRLVWFSQNIAHGRGLELILPALAQLREKLELTLIGNLYPDFYDSFLARYKDFIHIQKPLPQKQLHNFLCHFDVGLAIELNSVDLNRQLCLTNKIWAYFQAGLYILATDTPAQQLFMQDFPGHGIVATQSVEGLKYGIEQIIRNITRIREQKNTRWKNARKYSWDKEKEKLQQLWEKIVKPY